MDSSVESSKAHLVVSADFLRKELTEAFTRVWETSVCIHIEKAESKFADTHSFPWLGAVAWIGGSWTGNVRVGMPQELACVVTGKLLDTGLPPEEFVNDAMRELANMIAGNLKSVLPGRCGLATPGSYEISSFDDIQDEFAQIAISWYQCCGMPLCVALSSLDFLP